MNIKEAYELLPRLEHLGATQRLEVLGTVLSQPYGVGTAALTQYIAEGLSALLLDRARQLKGEA